MAPNWVIPKDTARSLVTNGTKVVGKSVQTTKPIPSVPEETIALVSISSGWSVASGGGYAASGVILGAGGNATSGTITVYAPTAASSDGLPERSNKVYVGKVNGRWEMICGSGGTFQALPMALQSGWIQNANGLWLATARPIIDDSGAVDTTVLLNVCCPTATSRPRGEAGSWRFWAIWRNERWESIQEPGSANQINYVGGLGIDVGAYDSVLGGRPITNMGVRAVVIPGSGYEARADALYLASNHFKWRDSSTTTGKEACLKTRRLNVVTDIVNGQPVKETIEVIGVD